MNEAFISRKIACKAFRPSAFAKAGSTAIFILLLASCATKEDIIVRTSDEPRIIEECGRIDLLILDYRFGKDKETADSALARIKELQKEKIRNKELEARIYGLLGSLSFELGDMQSVRKYIESIEVRSRKEEQLYILRAALELDREKQIMILESGLSASEKNARITLELAERFYAKGEYARASACYDDAFAALDAKYASYYGKNRESAYALMSNTLYTESVKSILYSDEVTIEAFLRFVDTQTRFLAHVKSGASQGIDELFAACLENGYIHRSVSGHGGLLLRKDAAYFFLGIVTFQENNRSLSTKYSSAYSRSNKTSPIPDVKVTDYFFDAVLILVEKEIMDLPDGISFLPGKSVSGIDLSEIVKILQKRYK